ncbi:hypothetical protein [Pseudomonas abieticivorans]|uniref:hypothetical protein n=1 Tax=Pseudomonas abieticivorans TaxID=2931382 RepID=UPI0020BFD480|nr:hypothetical protein [Pseudomonas sp. PIA16]
MNKLRIHLCAGLMLAPFAALAGEPCQIQLDQPHLDYGTLQLPPGATMDRFSQAHALEPRYVRLRVFCGQPAPLAMVLAGASQDGQLKFATSGHVRLQLQDASVDGLPVALASQNTTSPAQQTLEVRPGQRILPFRAGIPVEGSDWSMSLKIMPSLPLGELRSRDQTPVEATLTLQLADQ